MDPMYHEVNIREELLPRLVKDGNFSTVSERFTKIQKCDIVRLSSSEAFMLTMCYRIKLTLSTEDNFHSKEFNLVLKATPPCDETMYNATKFSTLFRNEAIAYTEMFPSIHWERYLPKYYYSDIKSLEAKMLLSDFTVDGYRMSKARGNLSLDHILEAVKLIAEFHGIAYALKNTDRDAFNVIKGKFTEARIMEPELLGPYVEVIGMGPVRAVRSVRAHQNDCHIPEEFLQKLEQLLSDVITYQKRKFEPVEPLAILCHGDFLRNNIAFKYGDEDSDLPKSAIMFDFQTFRYSSPMLDLTTFMANSTGVDVRSKHFDKIFNMYCKVLVDTYCARTGTEQRNIPEYLGVDAMLREYVRYMPYGFSIASSFVAMCLEPIQDIMGQQFDPDGFKDKLLNQGGELVDRELRALVCDMYRLFTEHKMELS